MSKGFNATVKYAYTGVSITIPPKTIAILQIKASYGQTKPVGIILSSSKTTCDMSNIIEETKDKYPTIIRYICDAKTEETTYCVWVEYASPGNNTIIVNGCMFQSE